jgi:hypothetical protein
LESLWWEEGDAQLIVIARGLPNKDAMTGLCLIVLERTTEIVSLSTDENQYNLGETVMVRALDRAA